MTKDEIEISIALGNVRYLPGSFDKRFGMNVSSRAKRESNKELTEGQKEWLYRILYKYRKQLSVTYQKHKNHPHCSRKIK